jgi:hypothetical protein
LRVIVDMSDCGSASLSAALSFPLPSPRAGDAGSLGPPIATGVAAPRLVAGAIAAMWLAYMM